MGIVKSKIAEVAELVDAQHSGCCEDNLMGVQIPPSALLH